MLVLSRHVNESITIGDDITVMVVDLRGDRVRLGITAPASVAVDRSEVRARPDYVNPRAVPGGPLALPTEDGGPP